MNEFLDFYGNATRSQYWAIQLVLFLIGFVLGLFLVTLAGLGETGAILALIFLLVFAIISIWLTIATAVRRCRTIGINPWWAVTIVVPYIGWIALIVLGVLPPKKEDVTEVFE
jgi:uncharacterized membrane protein YhaH (DUF805 family)